MENFAQFPADTLEYWLNSVSQTKGRNRQQKVPHRFLVLPCGCAREIVAEPGRSGKKTVSRDFIVVQIRRRTNLWKHKGCPRGAVSFP